MDKFLKRKNFGENEDKEKNHTKRKKPEIGNCPHSERCYRKNPHHFKEYEHPHLMLFVEMGDSLVIPDNMPQPKQVYLEQLEILKPILESQKKLNCNSMEKPGEKQATSQFVASSSNINSKRDTDSCTSRSSAITNNSYVTQGCESVTMLEKLEKNYPYNLFFTTIPKSPDTAKERNAITFTDLLCPSLGILKESLQINFMIDIDWLLKQYKARHVSDKPLTIVYGDDWPDMIEFMNRFCPNVKHHMVKMKDPFGTHHSKIGIYVYEDGSLRVVVSTANLYYEDWNHYNQGLWVSPKCKPLDSLLENDGESPTGFKSSLLYYLRSYNLSILKPWVDYVKKADFSEIRVFLTTSVPGKHYPNNDKGCHIHRVGNLLSKHVVLPTKTTPESEGPLSWGIIAQASSIGSMGKSPAEWLRGCLLRSLASHSQCSLPKNSSASFSLVYPSVNNVLNGYFGPESGGCLPYSKATNEKQKWLQTYMHQWKADELKRTRAMPHIKSYCRVSPCLKKLAYFLLTSANLSKSAWGGNLQKDSGIYVRSYEVGVLFLPKFFDEEYFEIRNTLKMKNKIKFPFMYDLPLVPYKSDDYPWCN